MFLMLKLFQYIVQLNEGTGLRNMIKILITGCDGFIGKELSKYLYLQGYSIYGLGRRKETENRYLTRYYCIDIGEPFYIQERFWTVIHLATLHRTNIIGESISYEEYYRVNVTGTKNLIESCNADQLIYLSSANIYDKSEKEVNEDSKINPHNDYEKTKYLGEQMCQNNWKRDLLILRPVNISGFSQKTDAIIPVFFRNAIEGKTIHIFVANNKELQILSSKDLCEFILLAIEKRIKGIYNLANSDHVSITQLAEKIKHICSSNSRIITSNNKSENPSKVICQKAYNDTSWSVKESIDSIINDYYQNYE